MLDAARATALPNWLAKVHPSVTAMTISPRREQSRTPKNTSKPANLDYQSSATACTLLTDPSV